MVLLIVAYYFGVTMTLTSDFGLLKSCVRSIFPILHGIEIPYWGYMLGWWNVAYCFMSLWP